VSHARIKAALERGIAAARNDAGEQRYMVERYRLAKLRFATLVGLLAAHIGGGLVLYYGGFVSGVIALWGSLVSHSVLEWVAKWKFRRIEARLESVYRLGGFRA
jgi:hypothetical protein